MQNMCRQIHEAHRFESLKLKTKKKEMFSEKSLEYSNGNFPQGMICCILVNILLVIFFCTYTFNMFHSRGNEKKS